MIDKRPELIGIGHWLEGLALPQRLAVGFSGGADSTALLLALAGRGYEVVAWHVDHGWHAGSAAEADRLQHKAAAWGIEFHRARVRAERNRNREGEARKARFAQFSAWAAEQRMTTLCLAQQRDDQAETVCMRLLQGAGPAGCAGMRSERHWQDMRIVRPLLHVRRAEIECALQVAGVDWYQDASNLDVSLLRNRIRHKMFPAVREAGGDPVELFCRWQLQAARLAERLDGLADDVSLSVRRDGVVMNWEDWQSSPAPVRAVLLQRMHALVFGEGSVLGRRHILLAERWREKGGKTGIDLTRCRLFRRRQNLHLAPVEVNLQG